MYVVYVRKITNVVETYITSDVEARVNNSRCFRLISREIHGPGFKIKSQFLQSGPERIV